MSSPKIYRTVAFSAAKHEYVAQAFADHPRFEIVGVADESTAASWVHARNESLANEFRVGYTRDIATAIAELNPAVAVISSESSRHAQLSVQAAKAGLHVVQDKPMAPTVAECDAIVEAVEQAGVKFLLWNRNTHPSINDARRLVHDGEIGAPQAIHIDFFFIKDAGVLLDSDEEEEVPASWLSEGELSLEGIYPLAYIRHILNLDVEQVFARTSAHFFKRHADRGVEDIGTVTLQLQDGLIGSLCIGRIGRPSHPNAAEIRLHLVGSTGAAVISEPRPEIAVHTRGLKASDDRNRRTDEENDRRQVDLFVNALDRGHDTLLTARHGRHIVAIVEAALASARSGRLEAVSRSS